MATCTRASAHRRSRTRCTGCSADHRPAPRAALRRRASGRSVSRYKSTHGRNVMSALCFRELAHVCEGMLPILVAHDTPRPPQRRRPIPICARKVHTNRLSPTRATGDQFRPHAANIMPNRRQRGIFGKNGAGISTRVEMISSSTPTPSRRRHATLLAGAVLLAGAACAIFAVGACGTDPTNVEGCRNIEEARCRAASSCPNIDLDRPGSQRRLPSDKVDACIVWYDGRLLAWPDGRRFPRVRYARVRSQDSCVDASTRAIAMSSRIRRPTRRAPGSSRPIRSLRRRRTAARTANSRSPIFNLCAPRRAPSCRRCAPPWFARMRSAVSGVPRFSSSQRSASSTVEKTTLSHTGGGPTSASHWADCTRDRATPRDERAYSDSAPSIRAYPRFCSQSSSV